jgi:alkanesulfonate monooxygenase SsuD/methylene tetrahydromethanopterin reductase-like flavin-dependent oxidoreductase (luciferase family)
MRPKLGITLPQFTDDRERLVDIARRAEQLGLDSVWVFDHLWPLTGGKERPVLECWTTLAYLAAATEKITVGTLVTRSSLRHPALLAKMAATVASIAPGRVTITVGSGDELSRPENEAFGIPYWDADDRIDQLRSTVETMISFLHQDEVNHRDDFVDIKALPTSPRPEPPQLWVGGRAGDTLEIAASLADGWNGWSGSPERFAQDASSVVGMAAERDVLLSWGGVVVLEADEADARERLKGKPPGDRIVGGPATVSAGLRAYAEAGAGHLICTEAAGWRADNLALLAEQVGPRLEA